MLTNINNGSILYIDRKTNYLKGKGKMSKITKTTLKSFLRKNEGNLYLKITCKFDSTSDCVDAVEDDFHKVVKTDFMKENTFGLGLWLVGSGRDYFREYDDDEFKGIEITNSCGRRIIAIKKTFQLKLPSLQSNSKFFFEEKFFEGKNWKVYYTMIENEKTAIFAVNEKGEKQIYNSHVLCDLIIRGLI
jgi:hypothetical protein